MLGADVGRVNVRALLEFCERRIQVAFGERFLALLDVELRVDELHVVDVHLIFDICGVGAQRTLVVNEGGIVILDGFSLLARVEVRVAGALRAA